MGFGRRRPILIGAMKKYTAFFAFVCWLFALRTQAQVIFSVRNEKLKIHTFTTLGVDNIRTRKNALVALTDSSFVVVDPKELKAAVETWQSTHGGLRPPADSLWPMITLKQIAFSDLKWAKINKPSGALMGMVFGGALGAILGNAKVNKNEPQFIFDNTGLILIPTIFFTAIGAAIGALTQPQRKMYTETMTGFKERTQKWHKYTIVGQLQKIYPSLPK